MAREFIITVYLFVFRMFFNFFKLFPQQKKSTFVASFGTNIFYTMKELELGTNEPIVIIKSRQCNIDFGYGLRRISLAHRFPFLLDWFRSIYHLATSRKIFIDNYYGFLAVTKFRSNTQCIQLWHAAGAIKKFGLEDHLIRNRYSRAYKRFKNVYERFDFVVTGSDKMAAVLLEAFGLSSGQLLRTGIPRTDFFFDQDAKWKAEQLLKQNFPVIDEKKVILYAPTYRAYPSVLQLDIKKMYEALGNEYVLFSRLHPKTATTEMEYNCTDFMYDVSDQPINHILVITDILITDYSSIPFEFSLLHKPMVFFAYDLEEYAHEKGLWEDYEAFVPGPVVKNTEDLIGVLQKGKFTMNAVKEFADEWNHYSDGNSSKRLIKTLYN